MDDLSILDLAIHESRVVLTMDKDFGELVYHSGKGHVGVLLLRMGDARRRDKVEAVRQIVLHHGDELSDHFCVYQSGRLRVR
jgi:predicted nuclease of predicted toxin-antitoxin system